MEGDQVTKKKTEGFEPSTREMRIGAGWVVHHLRSTFQSDGKDAMIKTARACGFDPDLIADDQLVAIADETATLRGYSPPGFSYHAEACATCKMKGKITAPDSPTNRQVPCPTCEGDGFAPPIAEMPYRKNGDR